MSGRPNDFVQVEGRQPFVAAWSRELYQTFLRFPKKKLSWLMKPSLESATQDEWWHPELGGITLPFPEGSFPKVSVTFFIGGVLVKQ